MDYAQSRQFVRARSLHISMNARAALALDGSRRNSLALLATSEPRRRCGFELKANSLTTASRCQDNRGVASCLKTTPPALGAQLTLSEVNYYWNLFVRNCAADVMAGRLTAQSLKRGLLNLRQIPPVASEEFRVALTMECARLAPLATKQRPLMLEIDAADRLFKRLLDSQPRFQVRAEAVPLRRAN
jgi:hypothetical protein